MSDSNKTMTIARGLYNSVYKACADSDTMEEALDRCPVQNPTKRDAWERLCMHVWRTFKDRDAIAN